MLKSGNIWRGGLINEYYADLHIQSRYTVGATKDITVKKLACQAKSKGLSLIGTGDCLHPRWREELKKELLYDGKTYMLENVYFLPTVEIKDKDRVHHLIFLQTLENFSELYDKWKKYGKLNKAGVPTIHLDGERIAQDTCKLGGIIGPAHIFVPWQSLYKSFNSLNECYKSFSNEVKFVELGLSADSNMADRIQELTKRVFLTNSDNHSLYTIGREFNRFLTKEPSFEEIRNALSNKGGRKVTLNVGIDPREGKYHSSACAKCYAKYRYEDAKILNWRCEVCGYIIRKGVIDRVEELATYQKPKHPDFRPPYVKMPSLVEIIKLGYPQLSRSKVLEKKETMVRIFGAEIKILLDSDVEDIRKIDESIGEIIKRIKNMELNYVSGGGGKPGIPILGEVKENFFIPTQRGLNEWYL